MRLKPILFSTALVASLLLNGAAVGYLYSQWTQQRPAIAIKQISKTAVQPAKVRKKPGFLTSIPEKKRQQYIALRKENTASLKENIKKVTVMRGELLTLLNADNFSANAYKKKLEEMIALQNTIQRKRIEPTLQLAESLTPKERKQMVKQLIQQTKPRNRSQKNF